MKKIAIYARKSKYSQKGESIQNQIDTIKSYCTRTMEVTEDSFVIFQDEGFTGGNTARPQFQKMLREIITGDYSHIVAYRLDRVSRSIADFSALILQLDKLGISFISVKEQFDTSTPIGRAMMFISSVFAQLERETISERVIDNMTGLTATGRYLAGKAPDGYIKRQVTYKDKNDAVKKYNKLEINTERAEIIKDIFKRYIEWESINEIFTFYMENNIKNSENNYFSLVGIRRILTNPVYTGADIAMYNYFDNMGCNIMMDMEEFNGEYGITAYRRHKNITNAAGRKQTVNRPPEDWLIYVGFHPPIIASEIWLKAQEILNKNSRGKRQSIGLSGVFSGMLYCGKCGGYMRPSNVTKTGFYYICHTKAKTKRGECDVENIRGDVFDALVIKQVHDLLFDNELFDKYNKMDKSTESYKCKIKKNKQAIEKLVSKLALLENNEISQYLEQEISKLHNENKKLKALADTKEEKTENEEIVDVLVRSAETLQEMASKRALLKSVVYKIIWQEDGAQVQLKFTDI